MLFRSPLPRTARRQPHLFIADCDYPERLAARLRRELGASACSQSGAPVSSADFWRDTAATRVAGMASALALHCASLFGRLPVEILVAQGTV